MNMILRQRSLILRECLTICQVKSYTRGFRLEFQWLLITHSVEMVRVGVTGNCVCPYQSGKQSVNSYAICYLAIDEAHSIYMHTVSI